MSTFLETSEDLEWLEEVHKVPARDYVAAILYGSEDCPRCIKLYSRNHVDCDPAIYTYSDESDTYVLISEGELPYQEKP